MSRLSRYDIDSFYFSFRKELSLSGFKRISSGSFRSAYRRKNVIIKIPFSVDGVIDNMMEAKAYKLYKNKPTSLGIFLAPCRLLSNYALMMPFVNRSWKVDQPDWVDMVEGAQVGHYKDKLVAFDYALDLEERYAWEKESILQSEFFQNSWKEVKPFLFPSESLPPDSFSYKSDDPLQSLQPFDGVVQTKIP